MVTPRSDILATSCLRTQLTVLSARLCSEEACELAASVLACQCPWLQALTTKIKKWPVLFLLKCKWDFCSSCRLHWLNTKTHVQSGSRNWNRKRDRFKSLATNFTLSIGAVNRERSRASNLSFKLSTVKSGCQEGCESTISQKWSFHNR